MLRFAIAIGILTLVACTTLGPDYQEPKVDWLEGWETSSADEITSDQPAQKQADLRFWWEIFNDPALNQLIAVARQENLQLRIAGLRVFESMALVGIAGSNLYPQVQQVGGAVSYVNNGFHGGGASGSRQSFGSYNVAFNVGWELDFWGRFQRGIESADATFFTSIANQRDMQVLISAQVANLYFGYRTTEARIAIAHKNAEIQKRSYEITSSLYRNGQESELDLQQAKTQYLSTLSGIPELEISLIRIRNSLAVLLGRAPGDLAEFDTPDYKLPVISPSSVHNIPTNLLNRRPDIRAAAWKIAAQSAQIGISEADYYPAIALLGSIGWSASNLSGTSDTGSLLVGPGLRWNIFDYGRIENNVRVQDTRLQQLIESYQNSVLLAAKEVDDAAYGIHKTAEQEVLIGRAVEASERALEIANTRYREGYADFQRVLDAQQAMFIQAERQLLTRGVYLASIITLYKGLGGGWVETAADQLIPDEVRKTMQDRTDWGDLLNTPKPDPQVNPESTQESSQHE
ncbi:MAG: TolC family protein [Gammaproteobacteria bacterium]|nr:MAG: TolC family protein [Gammaproteobacteria bacterium]